MAWRVASGLCRDQEYTFLTLTTISGSLEWPEIMRAWTGFLRAVRKFAPEVEYAAVKEQGAKSGMCHLHVLLRGAPFIHWAWLRAEWAKRTGANGVDVRRVRGGGVAVARYVAGYVAKGGPAEARKSVTVSRGWALHDGLRGKVELKEVGRLIVVEVGSHNDRLRMMPLYPDGRPADCECFAERSLEEAVGRASEGCLGHGLPPGHDWGAWDKGVSKKTALRASQGLSIQAQLF